MPARREPITDSAPAESAGERGERAEPDLVAFCRLHHRVRGGIWHGGGAALRSADKSAPSAGRSRRKAARAHLENHRATRSYHRWRR